MKSPLRRHVTMVLIGVAWCLSLQASRSEALLQLFNVNWADLEQKLPEIAEAGYTSLWLPPPAKAGSVFSVGYDLFDPFDLGDQNQRGTVRTKYGTKEELLRVVRVAHRFGLRVYFDNITNHRGFDIPGYNAGAPTNLYPGLRPQDFHLQTTGSTFQNWPSISDWGNVTEIQNQPLSGLTDLANEPGNLNLNYGNTINSTLLKPSFIRHPGSNSYYMATSLPSIGGAWRPFAGSSGTPVAEDVNAYLIRAVLWLLQETRCDGFRLDAVKHVPAGFFGDTTDSLNGYCGAIQAMYDYVHGYGNNVRTNGYVEAGGNRDSLFDTETARNDALLFGEHLGQPPTFQEYLDRGMRLLNVPYHEQLNNLFGNPNATLSGLDARDYRPYGGAFTGRESVLFAQSHDDGYAQRRELHNAYNFTREGLPSIYSDGYNEATAPAGEQPFPRVADAPFLGQFGDSKMPDLAYLHHQLARGGTRSRWSDADIVAYERYDYRETTNAFNNPDATVVLFAMNDNDASAISFDDGVSQTTAGTYYECFPVANPRGIGLVVGFPPGSVLYQLADSPNKSAACTKLLVRQATANLAEAIATAGDSNPVNRKVYVGGQSLAPGGGAIEFKVPPGSYVMYGYQWPEPSRVSNQDAITLHQNGADVPRLTVFRRDGLDGDPAFNPLYPFKMRGSVDADGNVVGGANVSNRTYSISVPVVTNAPFDIAVRTDASAVNTLVKLDGGVDLNSHLGLGPTAGFDRRDNRPGAATDVLVGYEQAVQQYRYGPEKFAAAVPSRNSVTSQGAETYHFTVGGGTLIVNGSGNGASLSNSTAAAVEHDPGAPNAVTAPNSTATQRVPLNPAPSQSVDLWVKASFKSDIDKCFIYFTTDGANPEGSFGAPLGTTRTLEAFWIGPDATDSNIDWWKGTIPGSFLTNGAAIRYKIAVHHSNIPPISDAEASKRFGLNQAGITNFNPATARVWLHNNRNTNDTLVGLEEGFHILRARSFLPRAGKSSVFNTYAQTFYYDAQPPTGAVAFPASDGSSIGSTSYTIVIRVDASVTGAEVNIQDSAPVNDDALTGQNNGNGLTNGIPKYAAATSVTPDPGLSPTYPGLPREYRFVYNSVPSSGSATISVRLRETITAVLSDRVTTLARTVNTLAPASFVQIVSPPTDNAILVLATNQILTIQTCFTPTLATNQTELFSIYVNGVFQPRGAYLLRPPGSVAGCGGGTRTLLYNWTGHAPGKNVIQVLYTNLVTLSDARTVLIARPGDSDGDGMADASELVAGTDPYDAGSALRITELANGNRLVIWDSVPNVSYQVHATTNLAYPLVPISPVIPASGSSSFYFDATPDPVSKFYRVHVVP